MARRLVTPVIRIDAGYVSRASAVLASEIVQEQIPRGTVVGERTGGVSSDQAGTTSPEILFQVIFAVPGVICSASRSTVPSLARRIRRRTNPHSKPPVFRVKQVSDDLLYIFPVFFFNDLVFFRISGKSLKFQLLLFSSPPPQPAFFLMDGHSTKLRGAKRG